MKQFVYYAAELLRSHKKSVTEIAEIIGYAALHSFSKVFKKRFSAGPSNYE